MIYDVLMLLSGHESVLSSQDGKLDSSDCLHPSEKSILHDLKLLATTYRSCVSKVEHLRDGKRRRLVVQSVLCAAQTHLTAYLNHVNDMEKSILLRLPNMVGAFNMVPLSRIYLLFTEDFRKLAYLERLLDGMESYSGSELIKRLRKDRITGYKDIAEVVQDLLIASELAYVRQIGSWLAFGTIRHVEISDIIQLAEGVIPEGIFSAKTAQDINFIGKVVAELEVEAGRTWRASLDYYMVRIYQLEHPIEQDELTVLISEMRSEFSRVVLRNILPINVIGAILQLFKDLYLLGCAEVPKYIAAHRYDAREINYPQLLFNALQSDALTQHKSFIESFKVFVASDSLAFIPISLRFEAKYPLNLFVQDIDLEKYNIIYRFLMSLHCISEHIKLLYNNRRYISRDNKFWASIYYIKFFMDNLLAYFHEVVIEHQYHELKEELLRQSDSQTAYDLDKLKNVHANFLVFIERDLLLNDEKTMIQLSKLISVCQNIISVDIFSDEFMSAQQLIDEIVLGVGDKNLERSKVDPLLLRLDGGRWFTNRKLRKSW